MFGVKGFYVSASGAIQGQYGPHVEDIYISFAQVVHYQEKTYATRADHHQKGFFFSFFCNYAIFFHFIAFGPLILALSQAERDCRQQL